MKFRGGTKQHMGRGMLEGEGIFVISTRYEVGETAIRVQLQS